MKATPLRIFSGKMEECFVVERPAMGLETQVRKQELGEVDPVTTT